MIEHPSPGKKVSLQGFDAIIERCFNKDWVRVCVRRSDKLTDVTYVDVSTSDLEPRNGR